MAPAATPYSLRRRLLLWLLVPLVLIGIVALIETYRSARALADQVSDRVLAGSAQAIGERVAVGDNGALEVDIPYVALDMLTSAAQDRVFYRIDSPPGSFITGYQGLPEPEGGEDERTGLSFHDAVFRDEPIRVAVLNGAASTGVNSIPFRVTVAETTNARRRLSDDILLRSAIRLALVIASAAIIVWLAVTAGLRPLHRLEGAIGRRSPDDLRPIEHRVPKEVGGLVASVNSFMARLSTALDGLRHFTGNASHQLRTPLAIVRTNLALSMRAGTLEEARAAAGNADQAVVHAERVLSQLLLLARVDEAASDALTAATTDLAALARNVAADFVRAALAQGVDLGVEADGRAEVRGDAMLLGEMLRNLIENVIRHASGSGEATVRVDRDDAHVTLEIEDSGPGMSATMRDRVFARFARGSGKDSEGAGLGLAIVAEIAGLFGGVFTLSEGRGKRGLVARAIFPGIKAAGHRRYLESRLAYRVQELAYGGLKPETVKYLEDLGEELYGKKGKATRRHDDANRPIAGTRLIREWQGVEHTVTVRDHDFEYMGRPYKSLSAVARAITGTRWNGWTFFGLKNQRVRS